MVQRIVRVTIISEKKYAKGSSQNIIMITNRAENIIMITNRSGVMIKKVATIVQAYKGQLETN